MYKIITILSLLVIATSTAFVPAASADDAASFTIKYRDSNRWVHKSDKQPLNKLTRYAARNKVYSFEIILPEDSDNNVYIERLLILSRIMKSRLKQDTIVFRQKLGDTPSNSIRVTPFKEKPISVE